MTDKQEELKQVRKYTTPLCYITAFGWLFGVWIDTFRWKLLATWFGLTILTIGILGYEKELKQKIKEKKAKEVLEK